eukprot:1833137-Pyramimonas_sp.AAC.2
MESITYMLVSFRFGGACTNMRAQHSESWDVLYVSHAKFTHPLNFPSIQHDRVTRLALWCAVTTLTGKTGKP